MKTTGPTILITLEEAQELYYRILLAERLFPLSKEIASFEKRSQRQNHGILGEWTDEVPLGVCLALMHTVG